MMSWQKILVVSLLSFFFIYFLIVPLIAALAAGEDAGAYLARTWTPYASPVAWSEEQIAFMLRTFTSMLIPLMCPNETEVKLLEFAKNIVEVISSEFYFDQVLEAMQSDDETNPITSKIQTMLGEIVCTV